MLGIWRIAINKDKTLLPKLYDILEKVHHFREATIAYSFPHQLKEEFIKRHGAKAYPVAKGDKENEKVVLNTNQANCWPLDP